MIKEDTKSKELEFIASVASEVHELFDNSKLWETVGNSENLNKEVINLFFKAIKIIQMRVSKYNRTINNDNTAPDYIRWVDADRLFYDIVYGYLIGEKEVSNYCIGGLFLATLSGLAVVVELGSVVDMYLKDDEIPSVSASSTTQRLFK